MISRVLTIILYNLGNIPYSTTFKSLQPIVNKNHLTGCTAEGKLCGDAEIRSFTLEMFVAQLRHPVISGAAMAVGKQLTLFHRSPLLHKNCMVNSSG